MFKANATAVNATATAQTRGYISDPAEEILKAKERALERLHAGKLDDLSEISLDEFVAATANTAMDKHTHADYVFEIEGTPKCITEIRNPN